MLAAPTSPRFLTESDLATNLTPSGIAPTRLSAVDDIVLWHLAKRTLLVDTGAGEVFRADGQTRAETPQADGHGTVYLGRVWGQLKYAPAHRVVWIARHGRIPGHYVVMHANDHRWDNRIGNLELLTRADVRRRVTGKAYSVAVFGVDDNGADDRPPFPPYQSPVGITVNSRRNRRKIP